MLTVNTIKLSERVIKQCFQNNLVSLMAHYLASSIFPWTFLLHTEAKPPSSRMLPLPNFTMRIVFTIMCSFPSVFWMQVKHILYIFVSSDHTTLMQIIAVSLTLLSEPCKQLLIAFNIVFFFFLHCYSSKRNAKYIEWINNIHLCCGCPQLLRSDSVPFQWLNTNPCHTCQNDFASVDNIKSY